MTPTIKGPNQFWTNYLAMESSIEEAMRVTPRAEWEDLRCYVLKDDYFKLLELIAGYVEQIADYEEALSKYPANSHAYNALKKWRKK
jgi:hypothetical protein